MSSRGGLCVRERPAHGGRPSSPALRSMSGESRASQQALPALAVARCLLLTHEVTCATSRPPTAIISSQDGLGKSMLKTHEAQHPGPLCAGRWHPHPGPNDPQHPPLDLGTKILLPCQLTKKVGAIKPITAARTVNTEETQDEKTHDAGPR